MNCYEIKNCSRMFSINNFKVFLHFTITIYTMLNDAILIHSYHRTTWADNIIFFNWNISIYTDIDIGFTRTLISESLNWIYRNLRYIYSRNLSTPTMILIKQSWRLRSNWNWCRTIQRKNICIIELYIIRENVG